MNRNLSVQKVPGRQNVLQTTSSMVLRQDPIDVNKGTKSQDPLRQMGIRDRSVSSIRSAENRRGVTFPTEEMMVSVVETLRLHRTH